jgi:hypothetical protein
MSADPAAVYERLKVETAQMLGLNTDSSSLLENLQVDLVSLLRLQIDDLQGKVLNGEQVDLGRLSAALTMLRQLLPEKALVASSATADGGDEFAGAKEELSNFLIRRADAIERRDERLDAELATNPDAARRELETKIQAALVKHGKTIPDPAGGPARHDGAVSLPALVEPAATAGGGWPDAPPQPAPPPKLIESDEAKHQRINARPVPANYLKQDDSPWRRHLDADGNIIAPYFRPG